MTKRAKPSVPAPNPDIEQLVAALGQITAELQQLNAAVNDYLIANGVWRKPTKKAEPRQSRSPVELQNEARERRKARPTGTGRR